VVDLTLDRWRLRVQAWRARRQRHGQRPDAAPRLES
jgi:hypothetical protein